MDIPESLLDYCGIEIPETMQGKSLRPMIEDGTNLHKNVYSEYMNAMPWHQAPKAFASMVRTENWKLVVSHAGNGEGELYDLEKDPEELYNLWGKPEYKDIQNDLLAQLLERWSYMADPLPVRKSDW